MSKTKDRFEIKVPKGYKRRSLPFFEEWLHALESGKVRQVRETLCAPKGSKALGYCCLGVLCRVQGRLVRDEGEWFDQSYLIPKGDDIDDHRSAGDLRTDNPSYKALSSNGRFPANVKVIVAETDDEPRKEITSLIECNDDAELTFKEIAKIIRRIWKA